MIAQFMRVVEEQDKVIAILSASVDELCQLLAQHISVEEFENLEVMREINRATALKKALERMGA